jgi:indole-3-glycerol phosphate synthase
VSLLADIVESKRREIATFPKRPRGGRVPLDVAGALRRTDGTALRLVAEIKLRSPSAGPLSRALSPAERALAYGEAFASMISVLCDGPYFDGAWEHVAQARARLDEAHLVVPILAKEYVLDERQIDEARYQGADAVLLIARIVSPARLGELAAWARAEHLEPLVEVADESELAAALAARARVIGVNARDLDTLAMDADRAARVLASIPSDLVAVHLSGIRDPNDVARVAAGRADAALIGEALMRDDDPRPRLRAMTSAAWR